MQSAQPGEVLTSGKKLIESWRARGIDSVAIETALDGSGNGAEPRIQMSRPDYGLTRMPFGKHKGEIFMDIPPSTSASFGDGSTMRLIVRTRFKDLADAIEQFLQQTYKPCRLTPSAHNLIYRKAS